MKRSTLELLIEQWAEDKDILFKENSKNQALKTVEEVGELASALLKDDKESLKDAIGDVCVTLVILAKANGMCLTECLTHAWEEIKNRKGKTVNGTFIKEK